MVRMLVASAVMSMGVAAFACPSEKAESACSSTEAAVTTVALESDGSSCASACPLSGQAGCDKAGAAVQTVALESKAGACEKACETVCDKPCDGAAQVQTVALESGSCSSPCGGAASVQTVAMETAGDGAACEKACATPCGSAGAATTSLVAHMPKMTYKVGTESMGCSKMAGEMSKASSLPVHYVVKGAEYDCREKAMDAHAEQLNAYMMDLVRIQYAVDGECVACPDKAQAMASSCESKSMQYRVGPATFDSAEAAIKASVMAYNAAMNVKMEYAVGEQTTACSVSAGEMAKKADCSVEYVVNGQRTPCSKSAAYMKTVASVESALKALETAASGA